MPERKVCGVCEETEHKYKCPRCNILYCSVSCYSEHKEKNCEENAQGQNKGQGYDEGHLSHLDTDCDIPEERLKIPDELLEGMGTEDTVSVEQLQLLGQSVELKALLNNPHLRHMLISLIKTNTPTTQLDSAMQEPIFTEFADKCLAIIHNRNDVDDDFPEIEDL